MFFFGKDFKFTQRDILRFLLDFVDGVLGVNQIVANPFLGLNHLQINSSLIPEQDQSIPPYSQLNCQLIIRQFQILDAVVDGPETEVLFVKDDI